MAERQLTHTTITRIQKGVIFLLFVVQICLLSYYIRAAYITFDIAKIFLVC